MYILGITEDVVDAARSLAVTLCKVIYGLICFFFDIFNSLGKIRLDVDVSGIFQRIGFILGLFMIFRLTFAAIEYLINPDTMLDKQKGIGNIIKKVLIVVILLGSTSYLFKEAYRLQDRLIDNRVIEKILLPGFTFAYDSDDGSASDGTKIAWYTFSQFYNIEGTSKTCDSNTNDLIKNTFFKNHSLAAAYTCVNERSNKEYIVNFDGLIAILCGGLLLWILATYTIQAGIRVVQLAYLEMIAPIPIMMYLMPKGEDKLKKWGQQCLTTFLDFFMRLAILDLVILLSSAVISSNNIFPQDLDGSWSEGWLKVVLLLATFMFAKRVPELIKEIFPSMGSKAGLDFGLRMPKEVGQVATFAGGAVVGGIGGLATGIKYGQGTKGGRLGGALTGLARGVAGGAKIKGNIFANAGKGMANQRIAMQRAYDRNNDGSSLWGRTFGSGDAARTKAAFDEELSFYDAYDQNTKIIDAELEKNSMVQSAMAKKQALIESYQNGSATPNAADIKKADDLIKQAKKTALQVEMGRGPTGKLKTALDNAEAIRVKGVELGYSGFGTISISTGTAADRAKAYNDNKDSTVNETNNIKGPSGTRNKAYKEAEANAKYAKNK